MQLTYIAMVVTILNGNPQPEVTITHEGFYSQSECASWKDNMESMPPKMVQADGKRIISKMYVCQIEDAKTLKEMIDKVVK